MYYLKLWTENSGRLFLFLLMPIYTNNIFYYSLLFYTMSNTGINVPENVKDDQYSSNIKIGMKRPPQDI